MRAVYMCEYCGTPFNNGQECIEHETNIHIMPKCIMADYRHFSPDATYPSRLRIEFYDGAEIDYNMDVIVINKPCIIPA